MSLETLLKTVENPAIRKLIQASLGHMAEHDANSPESISHTDAHTDSGCGSWTWQA